MLSYLFCLGCVFECKNKVIFADFVSGVVLYVSNFVQNQTTKSMKVQLNTVEDVERFVGDDPQIVAAIKQEVARGFESSYVKPIENCAEIQAIKRDWTNQLRSNKLNGEEMIQKAFCHAIESDVKALLEDKDFVSEAVNNYVRSSLSLDEFRLRETINRLLKIKLKGNI